MYTNAALVQHLTDAKLEDLRRSTEHRELRSAELRHDAALRITRPLWRWRNH